MRHRRWEDFPVGSKFETARVTVTETHVVNWASLTGDWYPLHTDETWARENSPFKTRIAHGPLTFGLAIGLVAMADVFGDSIMAWLGVDQLKAMQPVFFGDTLHVEAAVILSRPTSKPDRGVLVFRYHILNQHSATVMQFDCSLLAKRKDHDGSE